MHNKKNSQIATQSAKQDSRREIEDVDVKRCCKSKISTQKRPTTVLDDQVYLAMSIFDKLSYAKNSYNNKLFP